MNMDATQKGSTSLFEVYLRLRPPYAAGTDKFLEVDAPSTDDDRAYITIKPPVLDNRRRPVERFTFTKVFEEDASQLDVLDGTNLLSLLDGVLGTNGKIGRDALLATLGVTGSGKVGSVEMVSKHDHKLKFLLEPHHPRIQDTTRLDTTDARCPLQERGKLPR